MLEISFGLRKFLLVVWSVYYAIHIAQSDNNQVFPALLLALVNAFEIKRHVTLK